MFILYVLPNLSTINRMCHKDIFMFYSVYYWLHFSYFRLLDCLFNYDKINQFSPLPTQSCGENTWVSAFDKGISTKWNAISVRI